MPPRSSSQKPSTPPQSTSRLLYVVGAIALAGIVGAWFLCTTNRAAQGTNSASSSLTGEQGESPVARGSARTRPARSLSPEQQNLQQEAVREMIRQAQASPSQGQPLPEAGAAGVPLRANEKPLDPIPPPGALPDGGMPFNDYVKRRIDEDLMPLAKDCYETARIDNPELAGKVVVFFRIVPDPQRGSRIESAHVVDETSTIKDPDFSRCIAESMASVRFGASPAGYGESSIQYPLTFAPGMFDAG